jgi:hypothetical protein
VIDEISPFTDIGIIAWREGAASADATAGRAQWIRGIDEFRTNGGAVRATGITLKFNTTLLLLENHDTEIYNKYDLPSSLIVEKL